MKIGWYTKSIAVALTGVYGWGNFVVASNSKEITAPEWMILAGVGVALALAFISPNAARSDPPAPTPLADPPHEGGGIPPEAIPLLEHVVGGSWQPPPAEVPAPPIITAPPSPTLAAALGADVAPAAAPAPVVAVPVRSDAEG